MIEQTFSLQILASKRATLRLVELIEDEDGRVALSAIKAAVPLKDGYVSLDRGTTTEVPRRQPGSRIEMALRALETKTRVQVPERYIRELVARYFTILPLKANRYPT